ncbi:MAG TPA: hypothetical protein V6C88_11355 [Chroococcidiopsis sp.]
MSQSLVPKIILPMASDPLPSRATTVTVAPSGTKRRECQLFIGDVIFVLESLRLNFWSEVSGLEFYGLTNHQNPGSVDLSVNLIYLWIICGSSGFNGGFVDQCAIAIANTNLNA